MIKKFFIKYIIFQLKTSIADLLASEVGRLCMTTGYGGYICIYKYLSRKQKHLFPFFQLLLMTKIRN